MSPLVPGDAAAAGSAPQHRLAGLIPEAALWNNDAPASARHGKCQTPIEMLCVSNS